MNAIAKIVEHKSTTDQRSPDNNADAHPISSSMAGVSPAKAAELRMKNFEQLRYLKELFDDNIISENELVEQKKIVLDALRKLT